MENGQIIGQQKAYLGLPQETRLFLPFLAADNTLEQIYRLLFAHLTKLPIHKVKNIPISSKNGQIAADKVYHGLI